MAGPAGRAAEEDLRRAQECNCTPRGAPSVIGACACPEHGLRAVIAQRDHWIRIFNRLEAAVKHHEKATAEGFRDTHDEALYAARDRIVHSTKEPE
jgi:hypothetical protein